ncbi:MAG: GGDEF domain-containing protein [Actinomycetota bacterium]|nr:GGDEF domain-containing protein [Actinomycetota bacterium]
MTQSSAALRVGWNQRVIKALTIRSWPVWALPRKVRAAALAVEALAVAVTTVLAWQAPVHRTHLVFFGVLALGSVVHVEAERVRDRVRPAGPCVDLKSIWTFAGVLLLPVSLAVGLVLFTFVYLRCRMVTMQVFRLTYSCAAVVLATLAAGAVLSVGLPDGVYPSLPTAAGGVFVVVLAAITRWFVNHGLIVGMLLLSNPTATVRSALGGFGTNIVEAAAVSLGAVAALAVATDPWFVAFVLPPLLVLHQYERAARTDHKTGLANASHWTQTARAELAKAERDGTVGGILMVDLDHFKLVNDNHGHLAGDAVLKAVADALRRECREHDVVGRFGGEEFVVLLPGLDSARLAAVAERLRGAIGALAVSAPTDAGLATIRLTASIGAVGYPGGGHDLDELLLAADVALYRAKTSGRDRVRVARSAGPSLPLVREADHR